MGDLTNEFVEQVLSASEPAERQLRRQLLDVLLAPAQRTHMSYQEFLEWLDEDTLAEWVDGEVIMTSPASLRHQTINRFLAQVMGIYVEQHDLGEIILAPFQMKLETSGREPDLMFVAQEHRNQLAETYLNGPADLAVEIISPESVGRDRGDKFYEYEQAGVPEYWLLDPQTQRAEFYQLDREGRYHLTTPDGDGIYRSVVMSGFWLRVNWLWQQPLPRVLDVLRELGVV